MLLIINPFTDPAFNLALEEYLLTKKQQALIMLWRNSGSVIIGRNQNTLAEINLDFVRAHHIPVVRRLSGGGAVFHDCGNINFTLIHPIEAGDFSNYDKFTKPIRDFLQSLGVPAVLQGRNDLTVDGKKISGNAQAAKGGLILHHGTLLFAADVSRLAGALRPQAAKIESKGIRSVRARVANISDYLPASMSADVFLERLAAYFRAQNPDLTDYTLEQSDIAAAEQLVREKYGTWEWNFGSSPRYQYQKSTRFSFGTVALGLQVTDGIITQADIQGDFFGMLDKSALEERLRGAAHRRDAIAALLPHNLGDYIAQITVEEFLSLF